MEKTFSRTDIATFKKIASLVYPLNKKNEKLLAEIQKRVAEVEKNNDMISRYEDFVVSMTGYHVLDIVYLDEKPTNRLDAKGNIVYDKSWQLKYPDTVVPVEETSLSDSDVKEPDGDPENNEENNSEPFTTPTTIEDPSLNAQIAAVDDIIDAARDAALEASIA